MELLDNPVRTYAWGSRTAIAGVQGRPVPTPEPEAELWMGAHPRSPSTLVRDGAPRRLDAVVAADPERELGQAVLAAHGPRLPFLVKLLAADTPLSLQTHPDTAQAQAGYAAAEAAGLAADAPTRSYVDPFGKPELLCAVTDFDALCGFREVPESTAVLAGLDSPALAPTLAALREAPDGTGLRSAFTGLMTLSEADRRSLAAEVVDSCRWATTGGGPFAGDYATAAALGSRYPGDVGAVTALLMNRVQLAPGEAVFLPPGLLHSYLGGLGVEAMACSDNVLRGGLTPKAVDVAELLRVVRFEPGPVAPLAPERVAPGVRVWRPPVRDFALTRVMLTEAGGRVRLEGGGPRILFCLDGRSTADDGKGPVALRGGQAAYVRAGSSTVSLAGDATVFQITPGREVDPVSERSE